MRRLGSAPAAACVLAAFLAAAACALGARPFSHLEADPATFATIVLRDDIEIALSVIHAGGAATPRNRVYVLAYVERENRKGFVPDAESVYANLFLVRPAESSGKPGALGQNRYLVVNLWRYHPAKGIKTCHQWTIWEGDPRAAPTRATLQFLVEDFNNVVLEFRDVPLEPATVEQLGAFYRKIKDTFARRVRGLPFDLAVASGRPDPTFGAGRSPG